MKLVCVLTDSLTQPRVAKDVDVRTLDRMFSKQYFGKIIKWPNAFTKGHDKTAAITLMGTALDADHEMIEVFEFLHKFWKFTFKKELRNEEKRLREQRENQRFEVLFCFVIHA